MKMTTFNPYHQTLFVVWLNQILFFTSLIIFFNWQLLIISVIAMYVFGAMSEISIHRYFSHKSYQTGQFREKILRYLG